jgi:protein involved in sex pheromone biosynthesis
MIYLSKRGMNTMKNRFIITVLSTTLLLSGCACANSKEKKDEKVVNKD